MIVDLNPNTKYKGNKAMLQKICTELYKFTPPLQIKKGCTLAAEVMPADEEISFAEYKRDASGNFVPTPAKGSSIFVNLKSDKSGKFTGDYLHRRSNTRKRSIRTTSRKRNRRYNLSRVALGGNKYEKRFK